MKKSFRIIPILFFMLLSAFWIAESYLSLGVYNYTAIAVFVLLFVQLFYIKKYLGLMCGCVLTGFSVYKLIEGFVVYAATQNVGPGAIRLLIIKSSLFGVSVVMSIVYCIYYIKLGSRQNTTATSV